MDTVLPLLDLKLRPPATGSHHLSRSRLHESLRLSLHGRATAVSGGPGYGKTSLVARFLQDSETPFVWYRLDASDGDPWNFFRYLIHGIGEHVPDFGERSAGLRETLRSRGMDVDTQVDVLIGEAQELLGDRLVLVLDGVESLAASPVVAGALRRLLAYLPDTLHVILVGRTLRDIGLNALLAQGDAREIRSEDLLFTSRETFELLSRTFGLAIERGVSDEVHARTRGWVTALQLLRQSAAVGPDVLPREVFERTETEIFAYLSQEVLASESDSIRRFLLVSAIPSVFDPALAAEISGHTEPARVLEGLLDRRLFISRLAGPHPLYAFDPLFRDFLLEQLERESGAGEIERLHGAWGRAYSRRGRTAQALEHLALSDDDPALESLLRTHGRGLLAGGSVKAVGAAAETLAQRGRHGAHLVDLLGEACRVTGDYAAAVGHFERALLPQAGTDALAPGRQRAAALQGLAYALLKIGEADRALEVAGAGLDEAGKDHPDLIARILNTRSIVQYSRDQLDPAVSGWQEALGWARQAGDNHLVRMIAHNLGLPHAVTGDFQRASDCFRLLTRKDNPRLGPEEGAAFLNLARIATLLADYPEAATMLDNAREIAKKWKLRSLEADVLEASANLLRDTGRFEAAEALYEQARGLLTELGLLDLIDSVREEEALLIARQGHPDRAVRTIDEIVQRNLEKGSESEVASVLLVQGEVLARVSRHREADAALGRAIPVLSALGRRYQECMGQLWRARIHADDDPELAAECAVQALELARAMNYQGAVRRLAADSPALQRLLAGLPDAPADVPQPRVDAKETADHVAPDLPDLRVRLLGTVEVVQRSGHAIPAAAWRLRKALRIFCYLISARGRRATKERLMDIGWGETAPDVVARNFHPTISFLRRALNHDRRVPKKFILFEAGAYRLNPDYRYELDTELFEQGLRNGRSLAAAGDEDAALASFEGARALFRGPFLEDEDEEWTEAPRAHYEAQYQALLTELADCYLARGDGDSAIGALEELVGRSPYDEGASSRLMSALGSLGRRGAVREEYERLTRAMDEAFEALPGPEARRTYTEVFGEKPPR